MLRRTPTDPQRVVFSVSTRLADTYPCSRCQQGRLLLLRVDRCLQLSLEQTILSILNAAARLIFYARRSEHIIPLLHDLHWLRVPDRIQFRLCVLTFRCLYGSAPSYLANSLRRTVDVASRQRRRLSDVTMLVVPSTRRSTFGDRAFSVAAPRTWNRLPASVQATTS